MPKFQDLKKREWDLTITVATIKRVRELITVDLLECLIEKDSLIDRMALDPVLLVDVIYCICKPIADARDISDTEFGEAMGGDVIENATGAFLEALVDFFPGARKEIMKRAIVIRETIDRKVKGKMMEMKEGEVEAVIEKAINILFKKHEEQLINSPELSE